MTLVEFLEKNARKLPDKSAVIFHNNKMNYQELNDTTNKLASALLGMNIEKGDKVGLMLPRCPELVISFMAVAKARGIVVPINYELTAEMIKAILETVSPRCLIVHSSFLDLARRATHGICQIPLVVVGDEAGEFLSWDRILMRGKPDNPSLNIKDDDVVYLNYTSGSTGNPKGAITTHSNIYWNTVAVVDSLQLTPDDVHLCMFASFAHPHEIFARPFYLGGTMVLVDTIYPKSIAEAISNHKVTCMMGLPPMYENLLEVLKHNPYDLSSLRVPESGGMCTYPRLIKRFKKKVGAPIFPVWGSTETTGVALANRPGEDMQPGSVGRPCASYEVKLVNENGKELPPGEIGEMIFKGPAIVQSYYNNSISNETCFRDGWYYSSDLGRKDKKGNFYFMARKDGMMKVAGLKVYPLEIEMVLMDHPAVKEVAVIPANDRLRGEIPRAIIVTSNGDGLTDKDIRMFCKGRLANYKIPRIVEIRDSLPRVSSGKIDKKALGKMYGSFSS
jgi:acyl-CoA synthetase (AMP-forming)/AMP-acid ligase II